MTENLYNIKKVGKHWLLRKTGKSFKKISVLAHVTKVELLDNFLIADDDVIYEIQEYRDNIVLVKIDDIDVHEEQQKNEAEHFCKEKTDSFKHRDGSVEKPHAEDTLPMKSDNTRLKEKEPIKSISTFDDFHLREENVFSETPKKPLLDQTENSYSFLEVGQTEDSSVIETIDFNTKSGNCKGSSSIEQLVHGTDSDKEPTEIESGEHALLHFQMSSMTHLPENAESSMKCDKTLAFQEQPIELHFNDTRDTDKPGNSSGEAEESNTCGPRYLKKTKPGGSEKSSMPAKNYSLKKVGRDYLLFSESQLPVKIDILKGETNVTLVEKFILINGDTRYYYTDEEGHITVHEIGQHRSDKKSNILGRKELKEKQQNSLFSTTSYEKKEEKLSTKVDSEINSEDLFGPTQTWKGVFPGRIGSEDSKYIPKPVSRKKTHATNTSGKNIKSPKFGTGLNQETDGSEFPLKTQTFMSKNPQQTISSSNQSIHGTKTVNMAEDVTKGDPRALDQLPSNREVKNDEIGENSHVPVRPKEIKNGKTESRNTNQAVCRQFSWSKDAKEFQMFVTKENVEVKVYSANILCVPVDSIVNAANSNLAHIGGIAKAIAKAAGKDLAQEGREYLKKHKKLKVGEACTTAAGNMPYKCVIHAVGPCWSDYKPYSLKDVERCETDLYTAVVNSLSEAEKYGVKTVAVSSISSGNYGCPHDMCCVLYAKAVLDYSRLSMSPLTEIHFVNTNINMVKMIKAAFKSVIKDEVVPEFYRKSAYCKHEPVDQKKHREIGIYPGKGTKQDPGENSREKTTKNTQAALKKEESVPEHSEGQNKCKSNVDTASPKQAKRKDSHSIVLEESVHEGAAGGQLSLVGSVVGMNQEDTTVEIRERGKLPKTQEKYGAPTDPFQKREEKKFTQEPSNKNASPKRVSGKIYVSDKKSTFEKTASSNSTYLKNYVQVSKPQGQKILIGKEVHITSEKGLVREQGETDAAPDKLKTARDAFGNQSDNMEDFFVLPPYWNQDSLQKKYS